MIKIIIKYENEMDKIRIIKILSMGIKIKDKNISKPKKSGKFTRVYLDIE